MYFKIQISLAVVCFGGIVAHQTIQGRNARQVGTTVVDKDEHVSAETGFGGPAAAHHAGSKYFQYIHVPAKDHYEHGHRRGNEHHFIERHEKGHPHAGEFKTKVRWGDKHGGYGEHYWDYNHAGHGHDGDGEESQQNDEYAAYEEESRVAPAAFVENTSVRGKREPEPVEDVGFISPRAKLLLQGPNVQRHGGNYRALEKQSIRGKRENVNNLNVRQQDVFEWY